MRAKKNSFTLAELIVSAFILALISGVAFSTVDFTMRVNRQLHNKHIAMNALRSQVAAVEQVDYASVPGTFQVTDAFGNVLSRFSGVITQGADIDPGTCTTCEAKPVTLAVQYSNLNDLPIGGDCTPAAAGCSEMHVTILKIK